MADDLLIEERSGLGLASVMARRDGSAEAIGNALGLALSSAATSASGDTLKLIGTGPGTWLAISETNAEGLAATLAQAVGPLASISDQSGGYVVLRLAGSGARRLLQRGVAIDLDPKAFRTGSVAVTMIAHIGVIIWQVDDTPAYDIALFRSFSHSFRDWLDATAAAL